MDKNEPKLEKHAEELVILSAYLREGKKNTNKHKTKHQKKNNGGD